MGTIITHYFSYSNALSYYSFHTKLMSFCVSACKGSTILLNLFINFLKNCTKPKNDCTCCTVVGFGHSLRLFILESLICSPSGEMSNPSKVVVHCRKLHFFNLQKKSYLHRCVNTFSNNLKCSSNVVLYINMSSRKTTTPWSSMSSNRLFIVRMNIAGAFVSPIGITTHLYSLYWVRKAVFGTSSLAIRHYQ